jgi:hypothetical protein
MALDLEDPTKQIAEPDVEAPAPEAAEAEAATAQAAAPEATFSEAGPIPQVAPEVTVPAPEVVAADVAAPAAEVPASATEVEAAQLTASEQAFDGGDAKAATADPAKTDEQIADAKTEGKTEDVGPGSSVDLDRGMFDWRDYQAACEASGQQDKWRDEYKHGHTSAEQWVNPHDHGKSMSWQLIAGQSASDAVRDFMDGPTIADASIAATAREIDDVRCAVGDVLFDQLFGSADQIEDAAVPAHQRLHIKAGGNMVENMRTIALEAQQAQAPNGKGQYGTADLDDENWSYFSNEQAQTAPPPDELAEDQMVAEAEQVEQTPIAEYASADAVYASTYTTEIASPEQAPQVTVPAPVTVPAAGFLASAEQAVQSEDQKKARDLA